MFNDTSSSSAATDDLLGVIDVCASSSLVLLLLNKLARRKLSLRLPTSRARSLSLLPLTLLCQWSMPSPLRATFGARSAVLVLTVRKVNAAGLCAGPVLN
jgi:hypothetical protein